MHPLAKALLALLFHDVHHDPHEHAAPPSGKDQPAFSAERPLGVGVLLFDGFEPLDVFGPLEVFGGLGQRVKIVTVGERQIEYRPRFGPGVAAERDFEGAPKLDLLIIPGGLGTRTLVGNQGFIDKIKRLAESSQKVASVCTGSALLARTGLLDGRKATSNKQAYQWATAQGEKVRWVYQARWTTDGKFATSSGVSAGTDLAFALVAELFGKDQARKIARNIEYVWNEDPAADPFAAPNADRNDPNKSFLLRGVVVEVRAEQKQLLVRHQEVPGAMDAMTMPFTVDEKALVAVKAGDAITARLQQIKGTWWLRDVERAK
jgi:putative intracellular protease/amidase